MKFFDEKRGLWALKGWKHWCSRGSTELITVYLAKRREKFLNVQFQPQQSRWDR